MSSLIETSPHLYFSKNDPFDIRLGDLVQAPKTSTHPLISICGYPDDEGIKNNGGRSGAHGGPDAIRNRFYRMTPPLENPHHFPQLKDIGNLNIGGFHLLERHEEISQLAFRALNQNSFWVGLGGGHDYGFPDGDAFLKKFGSKTKKPIIINFDAHLDVRPLKNGQVITSGTPFYRLLEKYPDQFHFVEIGIQPFCNSPQHFQWFKDHGGFCMTRPEILESPKTMKDFVLEKLKEWHLLTPKTPCYLSVDIDAFSTSFAIGCSQSWPSGLTPKEFFPCFKELCNIFSVCSLGVYEVSPELDQDDQTAKLAAEILYNYCVIQGQKYAGNQF
ncbi:MAG: formimidoylglutamase [Bdellovibrionales bacterium]|nr:formimidoylglutamase [Bdellovibrionales bacterium]